MSPEEKLNRGTVYAVIGKDRRLIGKTLLIRGSENPEVPIIILTAAKYGAPISGTTAGLLQWNHLLILPKGLPAALESFRFLAERGS